jgi:hypothetical protein
MELDLRLAQRGLALERIAPPPKVKAEQLTLDLLSVMWERLWDI